MGYLSMSSEDPREIPPTLPQKILCIRREDCRTNASVLMETNTTNIEAIVMPNQPRWAGHCIRMSNNRLPRQVLFTQLTHGTRTRGGQRKQIEDTAKHYNEERPN